MPEPEETELQIAPPLDENNPLPKILIAAAVMVVIGVGVFMFNPRKTAELSVQKVDLFAPHTEMNATQGGGQVIGAAPLSEDDLYVVATLKITDKLRLPIFVDSYSATLVTAEGATLEATVVAGQLLPKVGETFPQILPLVSPPAATPIRFDDAVQPGDTKVGSVVVLFPQVTEKMWREKKSATLTLTLAHDAAPLTVALP
jgi:hypothetical protein